MRKICLFLLLLSAQAASAQNDPPELITDRPDQTESSALVPRNFLQIETGFVMTSDKSDLVSQKTFAYNSTLLRFGLLENFELRLGMEYLGDRIKNKHTGETAGASGLSPLHTGFKVKIVEEEGWVPEVALLGGLRLPFRAGRGRS